MFTRANTALGANWSLHDLRHTAAYRMARDPQMTLTDVQWVLGHAHLSTTPRSRNQRVPAACDTPANVAAASLAHPVAIPRQNTRSVSRRNEGFRGDFITGLPVNVFIQPAGLPITTSGIEVLRRPVESVLAPGIGVMNQPRGHGLLVCRRRQSAMRRQCSTKAVSFAVEVSQPTMAREYRSMTKAT